MTTVAIHQPQYLPWLPYFQKIARSDIFVYLDDVQYQKGGIQNRNQIKTASGPAWLTIPVSKSADSLISEVTIANKYWQKKHLKSIDQNYRKAKYYEIFDELFRPIFLNDYDYLVDLNIDLTEAVLNFFGITTKRVKSSSLICSGKKEAYVINICKELEAETYLSGGGAKNYQNQASFDDIGLKLIYHEPDLAVYEQTHTSIGFIEGMSALDAILNIGEKSKKLIL